MNGKLISDRYTPRLQLYGVMQCERSLSITQHIVWCNANRYTLRNGSICAVGRMCVCVCDCHPLWLCSMFNDIAIGETDTNFRIPFTKRKTFGQRAFSFTGPTRWSSLPYDVRHSVSTSSFKHALKIHLFKSAYNYYTPPVCARARAISRCTLLYLQYIYLYHTNQSLVQFGCWQLWFIYWNCCM